MENGRFSLMQPWLVAVLKTFAGKGFVVLGAVSPTTTFRLSSNRHWIFLVLIGAMLVAFAWASFSVYAVLWQGKHGLEGKLPGARVSVNFEGGWYDLRGPDIASLLSKLGSERRR